MLFTMVGERTYTCQPIRYFLGIGRSTGFSGGNDHIEFFTGAEFQVGESPDGLTEDMEIGDKVTDNEEEEEGDAGSDGVAQDMREEEGEEEAEADRNTWKEEDHDRIDEDAQRNHKEEEHKKHHMAEVAHNQFEALSNCLKNAHLANNDAFFSETRKEAKDCCDDPENEEENHRKGLDSGIPPIAEDERPDSKHDAEATQNKESMGLEDGEEVIEGKD